MSTATKLVKGLLASAKPRAPKRRAIEAPVALPRPTTDGGMPLMRALGLRRSQREFLPGALTPQEISDLLWAACGVNRPESRGRTAPSALDAQEIDLYIAMEGGLYLYEPFLHATSLVSREDARDVTGYQDFVDSAPVDLVYVADLGQMRRLSPDQQITYSAVSAGAMAQNVYLYCASAGLATVVRGWFDRVSLARTLGLGEHEHIVVAQTVGRPPIASRVY